MFEEYIITTPFHTSGNTFVDQRFDFNITTQQQQTENIKRMIFVDTAVSNSQFIADMSGHIKRLCTYTLTYNDYVAYSAYTSLYVNVYVHVYNV